MVQFQQLSGRLFQSSGSAPGAGWWGFVATTAPDQSPPISLATAVTDATFAGTFVYCAVAPVLADASSIAAFIAAVDAMRTAAAASRAMIFTASGALVSATTVLVPLDTSSGALRVLISASIPIGGADRWKTYSIIANNSALTASADGSSIVFDGGVTAMTINGPIDKSNSSRPGTAATLAMEGPAQGTFSFPLSITRLTLANTLGWGMQLVAPDPDDATQNVAAWLPLADGTKPSANDMIGFMVQLNPANPLNLLDAAPTRLAFTDATVTLVSPYCTNTGRAITLTPVTTGARPAALTFNLAFGRVRPQNRLRVAPEGDFATSFTDGGPATAELLCGMAGTESITFVAGYRLRFTSNRPAYATNFPLRPTTALDAPVDPSALLLDDTYVTAWATVVAPPGDPGFAHYAAAPQGAELFGAGSAQSGGYLVPVSPGLQLMPDSAFPLVPYRGFQEDLSNDGMTKAQLAQLEREIVSPTRRRVIGASGATSATHANAALGLAASDPFYSTTPSGFIAHVRGDGSWDQLLLAQVTAADATIVTQQLGFTLLDAQLQAAFQTQSLCLVVANAQYLGTPAAGTFMPPAADVVTDQNLFFNNITIGDWQFAANAGRANAYGNYRNVVIAKGRKGALTDLVKSADQWTLADKFSSPSTMSGGTLTDPDPSQLVPLAQYLDNYLQSALAQASNPFFAKFCDIIQREDWTGVLILRADIAQVPKDLIGVLGGVSDPSTFYAHHIGIELSHIDGTLVQQKGPSSIFGLVYYVDPRYDDTGTAHAIPLADPSVDQEFSVLTLKALFENTALKKFESVAELVLNRVLGAEVEAMGEGGNEDNAILLQGAFQKNGGAPVYSLSSNGVSTYEMANSVLVEVEIDSAVMSTRDDGSTSGQVKSWVALSGLARFAVIQDRSGSTPPLPDADIFSFGAPADGGRPGLAFSNLGLQITFDLAKNAGDPPTNRQVSLVESEMAFDVSASGRRKAGLFDNFHLELQTLVSGSATATPDSMGYLTVATQYGLQGVSGAWHGLRFKVNLGTPGALASKVNLSSTLLLAWSDEGEASDGYPAFVGIQLPGTGSGGDLFSLQNVLKLSIGSVALYYNAAQKAFLLILNQIALELFGLLKVPPNGATAFFLFGNTPPGSTNAPDGSSSDLAWFAIYNQDDPKKKSQPELSEVSSWA